jgi:nucleotide-binding universal stress UspA family protein
MKTATAVTAIGFRNILFATDFSPAAARAIPYVKEFAEHYDANLVAMHVRTPVVNPMAEPATWDVYLEAAKVEDAQDRERLLQTFAGIKTEVLIEEGSIYGQLQTAMEKNNTDLVILGTRGRTGLAKLALGSVAEEIFRTVHCPVLTVGPHANTTTTRPGKLRESLYATDFSPESLGAAAYAVSLAQEFQARLVLLHVVTEAHVGDLVSAPELTASSEHLLRQVVPPEAMAWCKPEVFVKRGKVAETILDFATLRETDLIVLGVRPENGVPGASTHLSIATAHKVVAHAPCPVLTVRH